MRFDTKDLVEAITSHKAFLIPTIVVSEFTLTV